MRITTGLWAGMLMGCGGSAASWSPPPEEALLDLDEPAAAVYAVTTRWT